MPAAFRCLQFSAFLLLAPGWLSGQSLIQNGGFEQSSSQDDLWDGVDGDGYLAGSTSNLDAIAESGQVRGIPMPVSVATGDLNGDGLVDIMMADPNGFIFAYINIGTKTEPKFDHAEIVPFFMSYPGGNRRAPRINLFDWAHRGMPDLTIGDYLGELFFIENSGSATKPDFRQPTDLNRALMPQSKDGSLWGNLFSPIASDLAHDGRTDLLVGEGSYSANSIHFLQNNGTNNRPSFDRSGRSYIAYGNGREHLTPTLADYNGDGFLDLLVVDRSGTVGVYLNPGPLWKPGTDFKYKEDLLFGGAKTLGGLCTIAAADFNGDGLFDLLIGKTNGRIALALNQGTKGSPKFSAPVDLSGSDLWGRNLHSPGNWEIDTGFSKGNAYLTASAVTAAEDSEAQPPEGQSCLRIHYDPSPNKVFRIPSLIVPGDPYGQGLWFSNSNPIPTNTVLIRQKQMKVQLGTTYSFSMKIKGSGNSNAQWIIWWEGSKRLGVEKITRGERNTANVDTRFIRETKKALGKFSPTASWTTVSQTIRFDKFANKDLDDLTLGNVEFEIRSTLVPNQGVLYLDDIQLTPLKTGNAKS